MAHLPASSPPNGAVRTAASRVRQVAAAKRNGAISNPKRNTNLGFDRPELYQCIDDAQDEAEVLVFLRGMTPIPREMLWYQKDKGTPLHLAVKKGFVDVAVQLTELDADLMTEDKDGRTPLLAAAFEKKFEMVYRILSAASRTVHGARFNNHPEYLSIVANAKDGNGITCLHYAASSGSARDVERLFEFPVLPERRNNLQKTAWDGAAIINNRDVLNWFASKHAMQRTQSFCRSISIARLFTLAGEVKFWQIPEPESKFDEEGSHDSFSLQHPAWIYVRHNKKMWIKELLRGIFMDRWRSEDPGIDFEALFDFLEAATNLYQTLDFLDRSFLETRNDANIVRLREPVCVWGRSMIRQLVALPDGTFGPYNVHKKPLQMLSLVMPFFYSQRMRIQKDSSNWKDLSGRCSLYGFSDCGDYDDVHYPVSLDEYCNPALPQSALDARNADQVLSRNAQRHKEESARILTVVQLWLWKIEDITIISFPELLYDKVPKKSFGVLDYRSPVEDTNIATAILLSQLIDFLGQPTNAGFDEPVFNTFANEIDKVVEGVREYAIKDDVEDLDVTQEKEFHHKIRDIRDELSMIKSVILQQEQVWREFAYHTWPQFFPDGQDGRFHVLTNSEEDHIEAKREHLERPLQLIRKYNRTIDRLDEDAVRVQDSISVQMDLKSKYASIKETHATSIMSTTLFGFTFITVVVGPLSFAFTVFDLPVESVQKHKTKGHYGEAYLWGVTVGIWLLTIVVTVAFMYLAVRILLGVRLRQIFRRYQKKKTVLEGNQDQKKSKHEREEGIARRSNRPAWSGGASGSKTSSADFDSSRGLSARARRSSDLESQ